jgi:CRP/FNR family cyclic AMP-dependent transcriptional regulator
MGIQAAAQTQQQIDKPLRASFIYPLLGPAERDRFIASARPQSWRAGEPIFSMGEIGTSMMLVQTGEVRISYPASDGRAVVLSELKPGAVFGEIGMLDGGERSADATAGTNCTLLVFERRMFLELLQGNWQLTEAVLRLVCSRLRRSDARMADLAFLDLPSRLSKALIARALAGPGGGALRVSDSQKALAALVGGSRENVNRHLRRWEKEGLITIEKGRITLVDPEGLTRAALGS